jgi:preprotein translocase subunit SecE
MKITEYIKETRSELKHVSWPTRRQSLTYTAIVIVGSILLGVILGACDYFFAHGIVSKVIIH